MAGPELRLGSGLRLGALLPVAALGLLAGALRRRATELGAGPRPPGWAEQVQDTQTLARSRLLRENGRFLPRQSFLMRKHHLNDPETGFFRKTKRHVPARNPLTDPTVVTDMMKGNLINVLPMILLGGWINWTFSGFIVTKVPFTLTLPFKPMLQRGINVPNLGPSWVSSASWYFLNVFGLRPIYNLLLGEETASEKHLLHEQLLGPTVPAPPDPNKAFKAEWEALELVSHRWTLQDVEEQLMARDLDLAGMFGPS